MKPPSGTETLENHGTRLTADPAAVRVNPRSANIAVPKLEMMTNAAL
jgi:hypothetical protein